MGLSLARMFDGVDTSLGDPLNEVVGDLSNGTDPLSRLNIRNHIGKNISNKTDFQAHVFVWFMTKNYFFYS